MDPKDEPICYDFALLFHEQKEQKKLIKYGLVIGYLLGNRLASVERMGKTKESFGFDFAKSPV